MKRALAASFALALLACSPQAQTSQTDKTVTFACANGKSFTVTYDEGDKAAVVKAGAETYRLPVAVSGSGARYSDGKVEFWEHQGEAMLNGASDGPYESCPLQK